MKKKLHVPGLEQLVAEAKEAGALLKELGKKVDGYKKQFRAAAKSAYDTARCQGVDVKTLASIAFVGPQGETLDVSLPDRAAVGNRTKLTVEQLAEAERAGLAVNNMVEVTVKYELSGKWAAWFRQQLESWKDFDEEGITLRESILLTDTGVAALEEVAQRSSGPAVDIAKKLLDAGFKQPTVRMEDAQRSSGPAVDIAKVYSTLGLSSRQ